MDRSWMQKNRSSEEYKNGILEFLKFAETNLPQSNGSIHCPCVKCFNIAPLKVEVVLEHLGMHGICKNYTTWTWHGELLDPPKGFKKQKVDVEMGDQLEEMIRDIGQDSFQRAYVYDTLCSDKEIPLYPGCKNFTRLSAILRLFNLKAINNWTDKSFTELLELLKEMLPDENTLPHRTYEAKKILCPMGIEYKKIHACPNDCVLYWKENEGLDNCPKCMVSRYKKKGDDEGHEQITKGPPAKVLWYLPIIPRFKRLFANANDAKNIRWHTEERKCDGKLCHPADSLQWKKVDSLFPDFGNEPRNLRLGLSTDGMNPYGSLSSNHSSWPVILVIYNLSPWLCMKRKYVMLSMMISGPKQPGNDIDVYLSPLIEDLKIQWEEGIDVFDGYSCENFKLRAMLFCTINDFPAYGNLSGYSVKGHKACPICEEDTCYHQLKHGKKTVYLGHRRFLKRNHPYRRLKKAFNGYPENELAPKALTGKQVYQRVKNIHVSFGKKQKHSTKKNIWKKRSVFFDLPYWSSLDVRHCIDIMHVEKNVCDSVIGTLLNIQGKTKDNLNSRKDLVEMEIREQLAPESRCKKIYLPPACHTLSKKEKTSFCECLQGVKVPQGYSSNVKSLVSMKDLKLVGLKSHDCHILMQQLLPVAIRGILPKNVRHAITRLCLFFNDVCSKVIDPEKLDELENESIIILCQLEMFFPPSFFDIMVHLIVHIVREIRICGPVYLRWMYPFERYMKILKGYVKNQYRPEASIIERYITEEAIEFCTDYLSNAKPVGLPKSRHDGKGTRLKVKHMAHAEVFQAHLYILNNIVEVEPYLSRHKTIVKEMYPRMNGKWLLNEHNKTFLKWFKIEIMNDHTASDTLKCSKDKNLVLASIAYFGVIEEIWELKYCKFKVPIFKCKWVNSNTGVKTDELGFTLVDLDKVGYKDEPFIMAVHARQVFYVKDPSNHKWSVVLQRRSMHQSDENEDLTFDIGDITTFSSQRPSFSNENEVDDVYATRYDHQEGILEDNNK
ncbi:uncharacterized protein LOC131629194 [Vicia villosa]|uniref:uncharacterized protein LOC131629194 n=1 Tax=Vicia villosa TaxID=3911 RepID=UPI00273B19CF|nr:uncharacterized protein LOC131629194 [Vicia villosa]